MAWALLFALGGLAVLVYMAGSSEKSLSEAVYGAGLVTLLPPGYNPCDHRFVSALNRGGPDKARRVKR